MTPEIRHKLAITAATVVTETSVMDRIEAEVAAVLAEQPMLPRTETVRRVLWALVFLNLFTAVEAPAVTKTERTKAA